MVAAHRSLVYALAFCSGFVVMALELLGGRILAPFFGSSIYVWGSIITIFMLSLSLGYLAGGRLSLHSPNLTRFGVLLLAGAVGVVPVLLAADPLMEAVFARVEDPRYGSLLCSVLLFTLPTFLLGTISPYSVRLLVRLTEHSGQVAGMLYFASTLGSALGTLLTSFYFVLWFEMQTILLAMGGALAAAGVIAIVADRLLKPAAP